MRTSKIEKEINQIIVDNKEVSNSILNTVKSEMHKDKLHKTSTFRLSLPIKYIRMIKVTIISIFIIFLPITGVGTYLIVNYGWGGIQNGVHYEHLKKTEIESIDWYNETYDTNYLWLEDLPVIASYSLSYKNKGIVMMEEQYQYQNQLVTLYAHNNDIKVFVKNFDKIRESIIINELHIGYTYYDSTSETMLKFNYLNVHYYLKFDYEVTNVEDTLIELFKNQSIFD